MNKNLIKELTNIDDTDFICLEHHFAIARMVRDTMSKNAIDTATMAKVLNIPAKRMKEVVNASYPFDLRILSSLQAFQQEIAAKNAKIKIESENISFAAYKHQSPVLIEKINKSLDKIQEKNNKIINSSANE